MNHIFAVAKTFGEICNWNVNKLHIQKILYVCQMVHLGRHEIPLIDADFNATMFGPENPALERKLRCFRVDDKIRDVFYFHKTLTDGKSLSVLNDMRGLADWTYGEILGLTIRNDGAWADFYVPEANHAIKTSRIEKEYANIFLDTKVCNAHAQ